MTQATPLGSGLLRGRTCHAHVPCSGTVADNRRESYEESDKDDRRRYTADYGAERGSEHATINGPASCLLDPAVTHSGFGAAILCSNLCLLYRRIPSILKSMIFQLRNVLCLRITEDRYLSATPFPGPDHGATCIHFPFFSLVSSDSWHLVL